MSDKKQPNIAEFSKMKQSIEEANKTMTENLDFVLKAIEQKISLIPEGDPVKTQLSQFISKAKK